MTRSNVNKRGFWASLFISPEEPRLRAGWRLLGQLFFLLIASIVSSIPLILLSDPADSASRKMALVGESIAALAAMTLSVYLARKILDKRSFNSLGLGWSAQAGKDIFMGIAITGIMMGGIFAVEWGFGWLEFEGFAWNTFTTTEIAAGAGGWIFVFLIVGWYEELFSRGYQLQNLAEGLNMPLALFLSSALFSLAHLSNPAASTLSVLGILAAGYFLAYGYVRTRQLWLSIGLHMGWNIFEGPIFGFPVSGFQTDALLLHRQVGPEILTGGAFGPEAGLILVPALGLGVMLIYQYTRKRAARGGLERLHFFDNNPKEKLD